MNYLIWKNIDSRTLKGLIISELPPITKPPMRVQETTIDGVDGSIIEDLGYEAYDKQILIGLSRNFDIDEIIKYFSGEGNIVFSNEPDKYYKAKIIEQIDYERLVRFRTATIKFKVQPFKYKYLEDADVLTSESVEGISVQIENTEKKLSSITVIGESTQEGTPTPEAPIEITNVGYENLIDVNKITQGTISNDATTENIAPIEIIENGIQTTIIANNEGGIFVGQIKVNNLIIGKSYTLNGIGSQKFNSVFVYTDKLWGTKIIQGDINEGITFEATTESIVIGFYSYENVSGETRTLNNIQLIESEVKRTFIPYGKGGLDLEITNGTTVKKASLTLEAPLRSLPNGIRDVAYIKGNNLYVERKIGKITLTGDEIFTKETYAYFKCENYKPECYVISNYFPTGDNTIAETIWGGSASPAITFGNIITKSNVHSFIKEKYNNNSPVYALYQLAESVIEDLGDISILELVDGTNTLTNSENANMIVSYIGNKVVVKNTGNYISKPVIEIKGSGTIELTVNDNKLFRYTFPEGEDAVVIDSKKQDAYLGTVLKNRNMSGEFPILDVGENIITWDGSIESIEITSKSRWL